MVKKTNPPEKRGRGRPRGRHAPRKYGIKPADIRRQAAESGELPHEFLWRVAQGGVIDGHVVQFDERMAAARAAAPFFAPTLKSHEIKALRVNLDELSDAELRELADIRRRLAKYAHPDQLAHIPRQMDAAAKEAIEDAIIADDTDDDAKEGDCGED